MRITYKIILNKQIVSSIAVKQKWTTNEMRPEWIEGVCRRLDIFPLDTIKDRNQPNPCLSILSSTKTPLSDNLGTFKSLELPFLPKNYSKNWASNIKILTNLMDRIMATRMAYYMGEYKKIAAGNKGEKEVEKDLGYAPWSLLYNT